MKQRKWVLCVMAPASAAAQWLPAHGLRHTMSPVSDGALLQPLSLPSFFPVPTEILLLPLPSFQSMAMDYTFLKAYGLTNLPDLLLPFHE